VDGGFEMELVQPRLFDVAGRNGDIGHAYTLSFWAEPARNLAEIRRVLRDPTVLLPPGWRRAGRRHRRARGDEELMRSIAGAMTMQILVGRTVCR